MSWRWAALRNGLQDATAYRIEFLLEVLGSAAVPIMTQLVIWYGVFRLSGATSVNGLSYRDLVSYAIVSLLFSQIRGGDLDFELAEMIRTGTLSNYLLRPVNVIEFVYLRGLAPKALLAGICLAVGMVVGPFFGLNPLHMIGAMLLALMGNVIHYQISAAFAAVAFYWEEAYSVLMVKNMLVQFLSGELIHLGAFPKAWQDAAESLPFYLYVFGPTQYALGKWTEMDLLRHLGIAGIWIGVGWLMIKISWGLSIKRYSSLGG